MKLKIFIDKSALHLTDEDLGKLARTILTDAIETAKATKEGVRAHLREKLGTPIEVDGVRYASRTEARKALNMTYPAFIKKFGYAEGYGRS
jgi:hypothetical protein